VKKHGLIFGIIFLFTSFSWGQSERDTICGRWVKDPDYPPGTITHFSMRKRGHGYEIYRTQEPAQKWSAMWDDVTGHYLVIIDGLLLGFEWNPKTDRILVFDERTKETIMEMKRDPDLSED
jgi:hypothetical protein